ncbi:MAG: hypothetical protein ACM3XM_07040 [Mycobacterium leprae]
MKQTQPIYPYGGRSPHRQQANNGQGPRTIPSTAAILARGISLSQVQEAVKRLRPVVERTGS